MTEDRTVEQPPLTGPPPTSPPPSGPKPTSGPPSSDQASGSKAGYAILLTIGLLIGLLAFDDCTSALNEPGNDDYISENFFNLCCLGLFFIILGSLFWTQEEYKEAKEKEEMAKFANARNDGSHTTSEIATEEQEMPQNVQQQRESDKSSETELGNQLRISFLILMFSIFFFVVVTNVF